MSGSKNSYLISSWHENHLRTVCIEFSFHLQFFSSLHKSLRTLWKWIHQIWVTYVCTLVFTKCKWIIYFSKTENLSFPNANQKKHLRPEFTKQHSMTIQGCHAVFLAGKAATVYVLQNPGKAQAFGTLPAMAVIMLKERSG